jgi:hypothetical protein
MDTLLSNDDGDVIVVINDPTDTLLRLGADTYTSGSATWSDQSGNGLDFTVSTNASLKGTDADGFPYMDFSGSYGIAKRVIGGALTDITTPTTGKYTIFCVCQILNSTSTWRTLTRGASQDHQVIVETGNNNLGLYDNNGSDFVDSGFDVTTAMTSSRNLLVWELSTTSPIYNFQLNESGTNSTITSATDYTLPFSCIGGYHSQSTDVTTSSQYWGNIYEFIVYDGHLTASDRAYVAEYLAHKWFISSKLPSFTSTQGLISLRHLGALDILGSSIYNSVDAAYGLRRLFLAYTGPQVRVRRSTDNTETDISFGSDGTIQDFDLTTWLGGGTAYVRTWYDQSGGAKHLTQTTTTLQPQLQFDDSKYKIYFDGSNVLEHPNDAIFNSVEHTIVARTKSTGTMGDWMTYVSKFSSATDRFFGLWYESNHNRLLYQRYGTTNANLTYEGLPGGHLDVTRTVVARTNSSSTMSFYVDGTLTGSVTGSFTANTGPFLVGGSDLVHTRFLGFIDNVMFFTTHLDNATSKILSYPATLL